MPESRLQRTREAYGDEPRDSLRSAVSTANVTNQIFILLDGLGYVCDIDGWGRLVKYAPSPEYADPRPVHGCERRS